MFFARPALSSLGQRRQRGMAGFSLIEVTLAVAVVAVAFIPLLGLMPMGLKTSGQAIDTTVDSEIVQQMTSQAQETNFSALTSSLNSGTVSFFDSNGNTTTSSAAMYKAAFSVTTVTIAGSTVPGTVLPGGQATANMATVNIYILSTRTAGGIAAASLSDLQNNSASRKYTIFLANNGL